MKGVSENIDLFSKCHPAVNFVFFLGAIGASVVIRHPGYLLAGVATGLLYYLLLRGAKGWKTVLGLVPVFAILTVINPLFNTMGATPLFFVFGRPYTLEALFYGGALASMFVIVMLWFGCYNKVLTSDKFTSLFGNLIPAMGKGVEASAALTEKAGAGMTVLGALTAWALEGSIVTGDSMRARGYGTAQRSSFMLYRMTATDWTLLLVMAALFVLTAVAACFGQMTAVFVPVTEIAPVSYGLAAYTCYLLIPSALHIKEKIQWHISRSKI